MSKRRIRWDALAAIIASLVGLLALVVAGYTAYIQRQQVRAQVWPHLIVSQSAFPPSIHVVNGGVGPAIVYSVEVLVDGKPQSDWDRVFAAVGMSGNIHRLSSTLGGSVLPPGHDKTWLNFEFSRAQYQDMAAMMKAASAASTRDDRALASRVNSNYEQVQGEQRLLFNRFMDGAARAGLQVRICYCSTLGECKVAHWSAGQSLQTQSDSECVRIPESNQFRD